MYNDVLIVTYAPFLLITVAVFILGLFRSIKYRRNYLFLLMCLLVLGWYSCEILTLLPSNAALPDFFWNLGLAFVGFTPVTLFLLVFNFYRLPKKSSTIRTILLFAIPVINSVIALTSGNHSLMREITVVSLSPVRNIASAWGLWFWIHTAYSYLLLMATVGIILYGHLHMPKFYRLSSTMMIFGISLTLLGNIIALMGILPVNMDPTLITVSLAVLFICLAIVNNDQGIFVRFSRGQVFHYLDAYILILGENKYVADYNRPAYDWFSSYGISLNSSTLQDVMEELVHKGFTVQENPENMEGVNISYSGGAFPMTLNLRIHEIIDAKGNGIGSIAIFTDVTQNIMLIERLEAKAGVDSLTGLPNRRAFEGASKRLDAPEHLPLSVIMCDVNDLKHVNDTKGHQHGDLILRLIAETLENICPKKGFVARVGGDEFIYLLSKTNHDTASDIIRQIKDNLSDRETLSFPVSVAMGAATKYSAEENLTEVITLADSRMYEDKKRMKCESVV